jgi:hypothetical protein
MASVYGTWATESRATKLLFPRKGRDRQTISGCGDGLSANRQRHEESRQSQRCVLNQLVGNSGMWSRPCPLTQNSSVPFHDRKLHEA